VVRTDAPVGHTPILQKWWSREPLSALSAISPAGKLSCHGQQGALNSAAGVAFLEPRRREGPGRRIVIWDGAPMPRRRVITACRATGARQRRHGERLPADAPDLNPGAGLWAQLNGVERRQVCGCSLTHRRHELRDAVTRVRRKPRLIKGGFAGAQL
jgi:transposase